MRKFRLHHSNKLFFDCGVKQYKTHTRTATITAYLISYIHYKLNTTTTETTMYNITIKHNTNNIQKLTVKYNTNNIQKQTA